MYQRVRDQRMSDRYFQYAGHCGKKNRQVCLVEIVTGIDPEPRCSRGLRGKIGRAHV